MEKKKNEEIEGIVFRSNGDVRLHPLASPAKLTVIMEKEEIKGLKQVAAEKDTTASEIVRGVVHWYLDKTKEEG